MSALTAKLTRGTDSGVTLIEVLVASSISLAFLGIVYVTMATGYQIMGDSEAVSEMRNNVHKGLQPMTRELRASGTLAAGSELQVLAQGKQVSFRKAIDFDPNLAGGLVWSAPITYTWNADGTIRRVGPDSDEPGAPTVSSHVTGEILDSFGFSFDAAKTLTIIIGSSATLQQGDARTYTRTETIRVRH